MNKFLLLVVVGVVVACGGSPYPGFKEASEGVHLRYISLGEGVRIVGDSDSVHLRIRAARVGEAPGSFWSTQQWYLVKDIRSGALLPVFRRMHEGDSMSVIAPVAMWPWAGLAAGTAMGSDTTLLCTQLSLLDLRTPAQMRADAERLRRNDPLAFERRLINAFMARSKKDWTQWGTSDMYYRITGAAKDTNQVRYRETVQLVWEGMRLEDGRVFDMQGQNGNTFPWSFGTPDQVIPGIGTAVSLLREGQEGTFILPSSMAFEAHGIPGTLEPNSPVVYSVRLVSVERGS